MTASKLPEIIIAACLTKPLIAKIFRIMVFPCCRNEIQAPKKFHYIRLITALSLIMLWSLYVAFLLNQIITDKPVIQVSYVYEERVEAPDIELCAPTKLKTYCNLYPDDDIEDFVVDCKEHNKFTLEEKENENLSCYLISGNHNIWFGNLTNTVSKIVIAYDFLNVIPNENKTNIDIPVVELRFIDPNYNPLWSKAEIRTKYVGIIMDNDISVENDIRIGGNTLIALANNTARFTFRKQTYESIPEGDSKSYIGLMANYDEHVSYKFDKDNIPFSYYETTITGIITIEVQTFVNEIQTETRTRTIFNSFGLAVGTIGFITGIYYYLFGDKKIRPWGLIHRKFISQLKYKDVESNLPLKTNLSTDEQIAILATRTRDLERLVENVVNTRTLNELKITPSTEDSLST
ncbi:2892_t:CDS:2 [Ambispora leptoticha]|uniref:2892_t:CDS:1 n=1 Tax=Ambispora leptoticha TaxID=144679 RepID=A0A9N8ZCQ0_9GLOM|nr:2892_t:CDS:2 [Ambispora leptoticha]